MNPLVKTATFYEQPLRQYFFAKKNYKAQNCWRKVAQNTLYEKAVCKMLVKLTRLVNLNNILQAAFKPIFFCQKITKTKYLGREKL